MSLLGCLLGNNQNQKQLYILCLYEDGVIQISFYENKLRKEKEDQLY